MIGDFSGLDAIADEMRALLRARDSSPVVAVNASMTVVWYETAKALPSYRRTVTGMLELARTTGMFYTARHVVLSGGLVGALSDGDLATAGAWLRELERDVHLLGPGFRAWHHWFVVWEALIRKDVARAASYQPEMLRLAEADGRPVDEAVACLMSAQTLHARGETSAAFVHVERARAIARDGRQQLPGVHGPADRGAAGLDAGRESEGLDALRAAMALGRRHGFVTSFVWIPAVMARLCGAGARGRHRARVCGHAHPSARSRPGRSSPGRRGVAVAHQGLHAGPLRGAPRRPAGAVSAQGAAQTTGPAQGA